MTAARHGATNSELKCRTVSHRGTVVMLKAKFRTCSWFKTHNLSLQEQIKMCFNLRYTDGLTDLAVISANKILATPFFLPLSCQTVPCGAWGGLEGDASIKSDRDWGVGSPAVTAPLRLVQASPLSPSYPSQAVIQNPFSNGGSPAGEAVGGETRFAYFPATAVSDGTVSVQAAADPALTQAGGESALHLGWSLPQCHRKYWLN